MGKREDAWDELEEQLEDALSGQDLSQCQQSLWKLLGALRKERVPVTAIAFMSMALWYAYQIGKEHGKD